MPGFQSPNHTQVPNDLFDQLLPQLGEAELRVILTIIRSTLGYHRRRLPMSLTTLAKKTGLSRKAVVSATASLVDRGLISKAKDKGTNVWTLHWQDDPDMAVPLVTLGNHQEEGVVSPGSQQVVTQGNQTGYPRLPRIKESSKETVGKKEIARPQNGRARSAHQSLKKALEDHFSEIAHIPIPKYDTQAQAKAMGELWWKPLMAIADLVDRDPEKSKQLISEAIAKMRQDRLTISQPKSILAVSRAIIGQRAAGPTNVVDAWLEKQHGK